jgi:hypothetical protein
MNRVRRKALDAASWTFGDAEDFLELTPEERQLVQLRLAVSNAFRKRRLILRLTQAETARRLRTSQARVAKIEAAAQDVTLDLMFRGLICLGGSIKDVRASSTTRRKFIDQPSRNTRKAGPARRVAAASRKSRGT